ncbi:MAG: hypothetical protein IJZ15_04325 [Oscillospiraceae bacterium]|nr:hypothetical protein [Oscillospiraceae bacterium]
MYIKDSSFYDNVRDTTDATLLFALPQFIKLTCIVREGATVNVVNDVTEYGAGTVDVSYSFNSGVFERDQPLMVAEAQQEIKFTLIGMYDQNALSKYASIANDLFVAIDFNIDEDGKLMAPDGFEKIHLIPFEREADYFELDISLPAGERGISISSINICSCKKVNYSSIEKIAIKEKNDIVLSSIPYNKLEVTLFDEGEICDFISAVEKHLRVLLYFQYNEVCSETFLYFYDEDPSLDKTSIPPRANMKFVNILGAMAKTTFYESVPGGSEGFERSIKEYLKLVINDFNSNGTASFNIAINDGCIFGGEFAKIHSLHNELMSICDMDYVIDGTTVANAIQLKDHVTKCPVVGLTHADALRLLINAQCHGIRVGNEVIYDDVPEGLFKDSMAVLCEKEYLELPTFSRCGDVDSIIVHTGKSELSEKGDLEEIVLDVCSFVENGNGSYFKKVILSGVLSSFEYEQVISKPNWLGLDEIFIEHSGSLLLVSVSAIPHKGYIRIGVQGRSVDPVAGPTYTFQYGNGENILEISNQFLSPRNSGVNKDAVDHYEAFNFRHFSDKKTYSLNVRGRFDVHPLDRVLYQNEKKDLRVGTVIEHSLSYNGTMTSTYRIVDEEDAPSLYVANNGLCSETLICREIYEKPINSNFLPLPGEYKTTLYSGLPVSYTGIIRPGPTADFFYNIDGIWVSVCDEEGNFLRNLLFAETHLSQIINGALVGTLIYEGASINSDMYRLEIYPYGESYHIKLALGDDPAYFNAVYAYII